ncbi:MAG: hypothetical protein AAGG68_20635 [Bacteroidota bacterium]
MKSIVAFVFFFLLSVHFLLAQDQNIHVFVALCDNANQGIVPVPERLGNGQDAKSNLYWCAAYGVKNFFKNKTQDWQLVKTWQPSNPEILERVLFKHHSKEAYLLADAYDGAFIKSCTQDFLCASNGQQSLTIELESKELSFGGDADLIAYTGHDGLMEFEVDVEYKPISSKAKDVIILACYSKEFFQTHIESAQANPLVWTTHLMAPEAYTLKAALDGWLDNETNLQIEEGAAQAYHQYQKCGIRGARNLFTTGF